MIILHTQLAPSLPMDDYTTKPQKNKCPKQKPSLSAKKKKAEREEIELAIKGRHDPVIVPRAVVVVECMAALTVADALLLNAAARLDHLKKIYGR